MLAPAKPVAISRDSAQNLKSQQADEFKDKTTAPNELWQTEPAHKIWMRRG